MGKHMKHANQPSFDGLNTKTKFALGLLSVTGVTGIGLFGQNQLASADTVTPTAVANQAQTVSAPATATPSNQTVQKDEKSKVPSPSLDQAVKNAQDAGLKTQEVPGKNFPGRIDDYSNLVKQADADYQQQVDTINQQVSQKQQNTADQKATQESNATIHDAAQAAQDQGVDVIKDANQSQQTIADVQKDAAAQVKQIDAATEQQKQQNQATTKLNEAVSDANAEVNKAVSEAKDAGVILKPTDNKKDFTLADLQADKEQQLNQLRNAQDKQVLAQKEYEAALEKVNTTNKANEDAYNKAQEAYTAAKKKNAEMKAAYDKAVADYDAKKAELIAKTHEKGYASELLTQALHLGSEEQAKSDITYTGNVTKPVDSDAPNKQPGYYKTNLSKGDTITVSYTNLSNSSYRDQKISKIVRTFTYGENVNNEPIEMYIGKNPVLNVWYNSSVNHAHAGNEVKDAYKRQVIETETFFDQDGKQITFDKDAVITVGSLNNWSEDANKSHIEKVRIEDARFIPITGGSISDQGSGWAFASKDNSTADSNWDDISSKDFYVGSAIYQLNTGASAIKSTLETDSGPMDTNPFTWAQSSTFVPVGTLPAEPVAPSYEPEVEPKAPEKLPEPVKPTAIQSEYHLYDEAAAKDPISVHYHENDLVKKEDKTVDYHYNTVEIKDTSSESASTSTSTSNSESKINSESGKESTSKAGSESTSTSASKAASDSTSTSKAASDSSSASKAASDSASTSKAASDSTSASKAASDSTSTSKDASGASSTSTHDSISNSISKNTSTSASTHASTSNSISDHESSSESENNSISTSTHQSISGSVSAHDSISNSTSASHSASTSVSDSKAASTSASASASISNDQSKSDSHNASTSKSQADSTSASASGSDSKKASTSASASTSTSNEKSKSDSHNASTSKAASDSVSGSTSASDSKNASTSASSAASTSSDHSKAASTSGSISTSNYPSTSAQQSTSDSQFHSLSDSLSTSNSQVRSESAASVNGLTSESTIAPKPLWDTDVSAQPRQTSAKAKTLPKTGQTSQQQSHSTDVAFFLGLSAGVGALGLMGRRRQDQ
ncbi:GbpC/Spa domain-containing protein [Convivina intestini]|uniref:Membrane anchored protein n=1 Tax=Convivina intestini TaxID=1505726 RepID=A0A2U1DEZ6_9LACO|nr:GbpC/Spa domain-containing protein [Convivina intestini]PVY86234.1 membrane anchored protein [Convivina intestini]CAH1851289.1 hypothetical protein R077811_00264 [Convivina intestini]SDB81725.1 anchor [Leuconostocaceae bacterium R-53105]